jgi:SAM-dependent methyltransferase
VFKTDETQNLRCYVVPVLHGKAAGEGQNGTSSAMLEPQGSNLTTPTSAPMSEDPSVFETPLQEIGLDCLPFDGLIIDVGGGSEGLVSRLEKERVCVVDISLNKVREAQIYGAPAQWAVSDGRHLCFRTGSFDVATLWFSLGYMRNWDTKELVIRESHRVLKPDGLLSILAAKIVCREDRFLFKARYTFPDGAVSQVGYSLAGNQNQSLNSIIRILEDSGLVVQDSKDNGHWFKILAERSR